MAVAMSALEAGFNHVLVRKRRSGALLFRVSQILVEYFPSEQTLKSIAGSWCGVVVVVLCDGCLVACTGCLMVIMSLCYVLQVKSQWVLMIGPTVVYGDAQKQRVCRCVVLKLWRMGVELRRCSLAPVVVVAVIVVLHLMGVGPGFLALGRSPGTDGSRRACLWRGRGMYVEKVFNSLHRASY